MLRPPAPTLPSQLSCICLFVFGVLLGLVPQVWSATVTIDLGIEKGPMNHRANGYLVSVEPNEPSTDLILPLKPGSFRGNAGYIFQNYDRLKELGVSEFQLTLGLVFHYLFEYRSSRLLSEEEEYQKLKKEMEAAKSNL